MEQIHGVDVSWMTHGSPKDKATKVATRKRAASTQQGRDAAPPNPAPNSGAAANGSDATIKPETQVANATAAPPATLAPPPANPSATPAETPKPISPSRPGFTRTDSAEKKNGPQGGSQQRRGSWLSSISSKFSSSSGGNNIQQPPVQTNGAPPKQGENGVPKITPSKNAVLQHGVRHEGDAPYTPAPPKSGQGSILHVFRRLSYSNNGNLGPAVKENHGLVERRVLNVDKRRERCHISQLDQAKLRRVAFCVDVEIAPMPKYADPDAASGRTIGDKTTRRKMVDKGEGDALKHPKAVEEQKEKDGAVKSTGEILPKEPEQEGGGGEAHDEKLAFTETVTEALDDKAADSKKKEKKKKSEEERRARKEKKRKLAEANGSIPLEIHLDSDSSSPGTPGSEAVKTQTMPTMNPVRIYRRCCQLRETPILKRITEQLLDPANSTSKGVVEKLDLTGYWMQLADLITLGDYLAVVPVKEVVLENCGLTSEGLRVVLAGLLAARRGGPAKRRPVSGTDGLVEQGGVVEKLVLKNNKIGPDGWRYVALFVYLCRSLAMLDLSSVPFPQRPPVKANAQAENNAKSPTVLCELLSQSIRERLAGSTLHLLNLGETGIDGKQLGLFIDGAIAGGIKKLGLANNNLDAEGVQHVARYLRSGLCEGLDLGGNDLRDHLQELAAAIAPEHPLYALSLADTNLKPGSLCKLLPTLAKLSNFRFIDLSHNHDLFEMQPSATSVLRRYLPKMPLLKRIHLADCEMTPEQVISLAEIIPEIPEIAHITLLENTEVAKLADARTEETQEEACAMYASLLAAARVSTSLCSLEIEDPTEGSGELVRALAKQIVAYCLRNIESLPASELGIVLASNPEAPLKNIPDRADPSYPVVLQHLVGHDVLQPDDAEDQEAAPDEDYIIGGTGIVKALAACLKNRGDESRRQSGEFIREVESGTAVPRSDVGPGKAKDMSKHLLLSARKIRQRVQPALAKLRATSNGDPHAYHRLVFLERTLNGIIKRFEDEFPETRAPAGQDISPIAQAAEDERIAASLSSAEAEAEAEADADGDALDPDEDGEVQPGSLARTNSVLSITAKALAKEEGQALRAGHKFRSGVIRPEHYGLLAGIEDIGAAPKHARILTELLEELGDEDLIRQAREQGDVVAVYAENKDRFLRLMEENDPEHWKRFKEAQEKATANVKVGGEGEEGSATTAAAPVAASSTEADEVAVED